MPWGRIEDDFWRNPKILAADRASVGTFAMAISYCCEKLTDGFIEEKWARWLGGFDELVEQGLAVRVTPGVRYRVTGRTDSRNRALKSVVVTMPGAGYYIPDFLHYHPSRAEVEKIRMDKRKAGQAGGKQKASNRLAGAKQLSSHNPVPSTHEIQVQAVTELQDAEPAENVRSIIKASLAKATGS